MHRCALCGAEARDRVSGVDLCGACRRRDPAPALATHGIEASWDTSLRRFKATVGIPGQEPEFSLSCVPELFHHKALKLVATEVEVADPTFDSKVYVRTSDPDRAEPLLADEGVQTVLLALLTGARVDQLVGNHVRLNGPTLTVCVPMPDEPPPDRVVELQVETAVLAMHLRGLAMADS